MEEKELEKTFIEEYKGAVDELDKNRFNNSTILFSKSLFAICDILIYTKLNKLPRNHSERFRLLEEYFPEVYSKVDNLFSEYRDAYSKSITKETCSKIKNEIEKIIRINKLSEEIKKIIK